MTVEKDKYTLRMTTVRFRVFKKDRTPESPEHEELRVLIEGREGKHWVGLLFDTPRHVKYVKRGAPIWLRQSDVEFSRLLTTVETAELSNASLYLSLTGQLPRPSN